MVPFPKIMKKAPTNVCRTCMNEDEHSLVSVFNMANVNSELLTVSEMLMECAAIQITNEDMLPKNICKTCADQVKINYVFKKRCHESEQRLLSILEHIQLETKDELLPQIDIKCEPKDEIADDILEDDNFSEKSSSSVKPDPSLRDMKVETVSDANWAENCSDIVSDKLEDNLLCKIENISLICTICKETFKSKIELLKHMKTHDKQCKYCPEKFTNHYAFVKHVVEVHPKRRKPRIYPKNMSWDCTMCEKTFNKQLDLAKHMNDHVQSKYKCHICDKFYLVEWALKNHLMTHSITCKRCFMEFQSTAELEQHKLEHKDHLSFVCKECGKQFARKQRLIMHTRIHTGEKKYVCSYCGKAFALSGNLDVHIRIHKGIKRHKCNICGAAFIHKKTFQSHHIMHHSNGERPYVCQTCGKTFTRQQSLNLHIRKHTGERRYACTHCDKRFYRSGDLKNHFVTHTGEKNYECDFCGKAFNRKSTLRVHRKIHTGERPHVCTICGRGFIQLHVLNSHMNTHK